MQSWCRITSTQWIQPHPCKTKNFSGNTKELAKSSWSQMGKHKVIYTDNSSEFGKACEDLSRNHCTSTPHRSETNGIAERAVRRIMEGTRCCCSPVWMKIGGQIRWNVKPTCETFKTSSPMGKLHARGVLANHLMDTNHSV